MLKTDDYFGIISRLDAGAILIYKCEGRIASALCIYLFLKKKIVSNTHYQWCS